MAQSIKLFVVWAIVLFLLNYYRIFIMILNSLLSLLYYEFQGIFKKICNSQTAEKEEIYISRLSSSYFPYFLNQILLFSCTLSTEAPEKLLCICFLLSVCSSICLRIQQYSSFCAEITDQKRRKKRKITKNKESDL